MTATERRLLEFLRSCEQPASGTEIARQLWPDSPGWNRVFRCGQHGSTAGAAMRRLGGSYASRVARHRGWVGYDYGSTHLRRYFITSSGAKALEAEESR